MFFLEREEDYAKQIDAAGLANSSCKMPFYTTHWVQIAICKERAPLEEYAKHIKSETRIISNETQEQEDNA